MIRVRWRVRHIDAPPECLAWADGETEIRAGAEAQLEHMDRDGRGGVALVESRVRVKISKVLSPVRALKEGAGSALGRFGARVEILPIAGASRKPPVGWVVHPDTIPEDTQRGAAHYS